jgi:hypothetical protein
MTDYSTKRRTRYLFDPRSKEPYKLSRSKIDLFVECPRCFYIDQRLGVGRPKSFPFNLNSAVDKLLKKEFDIHRAAQTRHPLIETYGVDAVPFAHERMDEWRDSLTRGVSCVHKPSNLHIRGGVDDVWITSKKELVIVDYKATSKDGEVNLDAQWQDGYKRQMEIYQWLFRQNGFKVSDTGYFVYVNGKTDRKAFDGRLEFDVKLIPYTGSGDWIENVLLSIRKCLMDDRLPKKRSTCDYCNYIDLVKEVEEENLLLRKKTMKGTDKTDKKSDTKKTRALFE